MAKLGRRFTFDLEEMFALRKKGWNYSELARKYKKDHTTILYHCRKWNVDPYIKAPVVLPVEIKEELVILLTPRRLYKYDYLLYERINKGKNYKQYVEEAKKRALLRKSARLAAAPQEERGENHPTGARLVP